MRALESRLLDSRQARSQSYKVAALVAALGTALISIVTLGAWISMARRTNRQLIKLNRNLLQANTEREAGEATLRQLLKMEAIGQLTGGVAHDFNNMLAVVLGALRLATKRLAKGDTNIQTLIMARLKGRSGQRLSLNACLHFRVSSHWSHSRFYQTSSSVACPT